MLKYIFPFFEEEINFQKDKFAFDQQNKQKVRFMYSLTFLFINLLFLSYLDIL